MNGWISVVVIVLVELALVVRLGRLAVRRWWDWLAIALLTALFVAPTAHYLTGDISRYLPTAIWSHDSDGKDQIIWASAASTILLPLIAAALWVLLLRSMWPSARREEADRAHKDTA